MSNSPLPRRFVVCVALALIAFAADAQDGRGRPFLSYLFGYGFIFQILAVVHWAKRGRDRFWIWIIIIGGFIGALAYFVVEGLPDWQDLKRSLKGPARRKRIATLRAMILDNPSAGNYEELGDLLIQQKRWEEARNAFDKAIAARPDSLDSFYWRGVAAFEVGDDEAALKDLQYVVKIQPKYDYSKAQCLVARALARSGRTAEAEVAFDRLTEITTSAPSLVSAAEFFAANGRVGEARELVEAIVARKATMPAYQKRRDRTALRKAARLARKLRGLKDAPVTGRVIA